MIKNNKYSDLILFIYVFFFYFSIDGFYAIQRFKSIGINAQGNLSIQEYFRHFIFIFEYILAVVFIFTCTKIKFKYSFPLIFLLFIAILIDLIVFKIQGSPASLSNISNFNGAIGNLKDALKEFRITILESIFVTTFLFIPIIIKSVTCKTIKKSNIRNCFFSFLIISGIYVATLITRGEPALIGFPKGFSYAFGSATLKINELVISPIEYSLNRYDNFPSSEIDKIILIIDESIEYQTFRRLNDEQKFLRIIDYGRSYSGSNCSASSNYILRRASWQKTENRANLIFEVESLFSLAKKNYYRTVYIDNQNILNDPTVKNYFDKKEISKIDYILIPENEPHKRDFASLNKLNELKKSKGKIFIIINKYGSHFPYDLTLPPNERSFDKIDNYKKSVKRNSVEYLIQLSKIADKHTLFFYTSDHGQNLFGRTSHCNVGNQIDKSEFEVPFLVLTGNDEVFKFLSAKKNLFKNKTNHLQVAESVRNAIGFELKSIGSIFKEPKHENMNFCPLYGSPKPIFGIYPKCFPLE
jgi:hypothetical protein